MVTEIERLAMDSAADATEFNHQCNLAPIDLRTRYRNRIGQVVANLLASIPRHYPRVKLSGERRRTSRFVRWIRKLGSPFNAKYYLRVAWTRICAPKILQEKRFLQL